MCGMHQQFGQIGLEQAQPRLRRRRWPWVTALVLAPALAVTGVIWGVTSRGSAEETARAFLTGEEPPAHSWGYRGDLAFAVVVEGCGAGSEVAAPIAATFLTGL